jgi:NAD(P)-dependent dehydrogenase (short-subunit alcohol dehydrogenase family)
VSLEGQVAVVEDGGSELGRAIALALSAHGVSVVICGDVEKPLGETVGHVVYAGGKARHVVGSVDDAAARAREVFGRVDIVIEADRLAQLVVALCAGKAIDRALTLRLC